MSILSVKNLKKYINGETLFENINFEIKEQEKVALIGDNGTGKTTLLKTIIGTSHEDDGTILMPKNTEVGYLSQTVIESTAHTLMEEMLTVFKDLIAYEKRLGELMVQITDNPTDETLIEKYGKMEEQFSAMGGYMYLTEINMVLSKFKLTKDMYERKIETFSGGERAKVAFSKLLLKKPNLLILDEPTNHLDIETIGWLEGYLKGYQGAILLVTHDRYFMDNVCSKTLELVHNTIEVYNGNYSYYLSERDVRRMQQQKAYVRQQKEIADLENFIRRFKAKASKAKQAKDREKKLARIERIDAPKHDKEAIEFRIAGQRLSKNDILHVENLKVGYDTPLFNDLSFSLRDGDKLAIIGANGVGKTTLIKTLMEKLTPLGGKCEWLRLPEFAYFDQNQFRLNDDDLLFDVVSDMFPKWDNTKIRNTLANYDFKGEDVYKKVKVLSGGERVRLLFMKLLLNPSNVLVLDEPTNHLDIKTKTMLEQALATVSKTVIFISHDRYFINEVANKILNITQNNAEFFEGQLQEYIALKDEELRLKQEALQQTKAKQLATKKKKTKSLEQIEKLIEEKEAEIIVLKEAMYLEENYTDSLKIKEINSKIVQLTDEIDELFLELE